MKQRIGNRLAVVMAGLQQKIVHQLQRAEQKCTLRQRKLVLLLLLLAYGGYCLYVFGRAVSAPPPKGPAVIAIDSIGVAPAAKRYN